MTRPAAAAFFDLDRTLLAGASGEIFSRAMREAGVTSREIPGEKLMFQVFNTVGETLPSMMLTRQAVRLAKGRKRSAVQRAAMHASVELASLVQPMAGELFAQHRAAGRKVVMATTTPYDLVKPLADLLGLDDVIATRYGVNANGTYDGSIDGPFVWSFGKREAVEAWAARHHVDLAQSYAYSDSIYDVPLLSAVGHPAAVNPDPRLRLMAAVRRWPTVSLAAPSTGFKVPILNRDLASLSMELANPLFYPFARFDIDGTEHIPASGAAIIVGNHRSYFDPIAIAMAMGRTKRTMKFLGKKEVFNAPIIGPLAKAAGGIPVDRASGSDAPLLAAEEAIAQGDIVGIMPQGTIPRGAAFYEPTLKGRWGAAKLAAATRVPVIPFGLWGTEHVWPRSSRLPAVFNVLNPPTVQVRVGPPVALTYRSADADTKRIMKAIMALLPPESRHAHTPTEEEIARALPPGYHGDLLHEGERRPGTD